MSSSPPRYTIHLALTTGDATLHASTHQEVAAKINEAIGYPMVTRAVVINWLCRRKKAAKYGFVSVTKGATPC
jgi:hypothetical protein